MGSLDNSAVQKGTTILITGVNGFLGSHIADQFLGRGYKVRGTVRNVDKCSWLVKLFDKKYGEGRFHLAEVPNMIADGAFDEAVKGASVFVHTTSVVSFDPNPHNVIPTAIDGAVKALKAAYSETSVKRFVFTSSSTAAVSATPGKPGIIVAEDTWNEDAIKEAWKEPPYGPDRVWSVYAASKAQSEQEVWRFHNEHRHRRPDIVVNSVLPAFNFGQVLDPVNQGFPSTAGLVSTLWKGEVTSMHKMIVRDYYVNAQDTGKLHFAAAISPNVKDMRIFAFAGGFSWNSILDILHAHEPDREFPANFSGGTDPNEIRPSVKAERLLQDMGFLGWISLEKSIVDNVEQLKTLTKD
ncbi:Aldehyde reductase [Fusarium albosuccineum]|uniref:Aldehyde reductase n=1 Tax=Fusarium albosuccineum TaxID=1237068 RepID=A0A8H4KRE6_9HYPO|nr:Aldehyde reductase [Fusarium albosuccineum]